MTNFIFRVIILLKASLQGENHIMKTTKKQQLLYSTILHKIYTKHTISRIDIARDTGITPATVSLLTAEMLSDDLIREVGEEIDLQDKVGRKKILLSVAPSHSYYIGAEISEKFFSFVLTDNTGILLQKETVSHDKNSPVDSDFFMKSLAGFLNKTEYTDRVRAIGVAIPGHYTKEAPEKILTNNASWKNFNLRKIAEYFDIPLYFSNNVHCMTRAESLFYTKPDIDNSNFLFFHIGRGIHCTHLYHDTLYGSQNLKDVYKRQSLLSPPSSMIRESSLHPMIASIFSVFNPPYINCCFG